MTTSVQYYQLPHRFIHDLVSFVVLQNYLHHSEGRGSGVLEAETATLCAEEAQYTNSRIFAAVSRDRLCGSIRIFKKEPFQQLPMEKLFSFHHGTLPEKDQPVYHIGRFAIAKGSDDRNFRIFKTLMALALNVAEEDDSGTVFAECDLKLLRTIRLLGIEAEAIGHPIYYLGSETVPIRLRRKGYQNFLNNNRDLSGVEVGIYGQESPNMNPLP